jgi:hypothetical protein
MEVMEHETCSEWKRVMIMRKGRSVIVLAVQQVFQFLRPIISLED